MVRALSLGELVPTSRVDGEGFLVERDVDLAYYNDHKKEIDADFAEAERIAAEGPASEAELKRRPGR